MRPVKSTQKGTFVWFGARGARKFKFFAIFLLAGASGQELRPFHITDPSWRQLNEGCTGSGEVKRRLAYEEYFPKLSRTDP